MRRLSPSAGIAIGPILFIIAILGILASVMSSGSSSFGTAGNADRITSDIKNQAGLIRTKINECYMQYVVNGVNNASAPCLNDAYPCSDPTNGSLVSSLTCPGDPLDEATASQRSLWTGLRVTALPPPTAGFTQWFYINAGDAGGRCIWTSPGDPSAATWSAPASPVSSAAIKAGLSAAANRFTSQEIAYDSSSNSQKFVLFITRPTGTVDAHCTVP